VFFHGGRYLVPAGSEGLAAIADEVWRTGDGNAWQSLDFGSSTARYYRAKVQRSWFAHHLHGGAATDLPEALVFQTGANAWSRFDDWPPRAVRRG